MFNSQFYMTEANNMYPVELLVVHHRLFNVDKLTLVIYDHYSHIISRLIFLMDMFCNV